ETKRHAPTTAIPGHSLSAIRNPKSAISSLFTTRYSLLTPSPTLRPMLAAWLHDLSPYALRISGDFGLRWYGLSYAAAFLVGWLLLRWLGRRGAILIPPERAGDAILYAVVGVVVGGRLGYCLF